MDKRIFLTALIFVVLIAFSTPCYAPWIWTPDGGWANEKDVVQESPRAQWEYALTLEKKGEYNNAIRAYKALIKAYPTSPLSARSLEKVAYCYEHEGDLYKAFKAYQKLIENYPNEIDFDAVLQKEYRIGQLFASGKFRRIFKIPIMPALDKGVEILETIVKNAPYSDTAPQAQFKVGLAYKKMGKLTEATEAFDKVVKDYSNTPWYEESLYQLGWCNYLKSKGFSYDQAAAKESIIVFNRFLKEFPNSKHTQKIRTILGRLEGRQSKNLLEIGHFYEKHGHNKAAIMYYNELIEKYPDSEEAQSVKKRLEKLEKTR